MISADCVNTQSTNGRNATPIAIIESARKVLGGIELDPSSDEVINRDVKAERYYTLENNGFTQDWKARSVWLNAPGKSVSRGKQITASQWYRKLYRCWTTGSVENAIGLVYRSGSIGSLGEAILRQPICLTCAGSSSPVVNGSGRISFETIEGERRVPGVTNTQASLFFLLTRDPIIQAKFGQEFSQYGVVR